MKNSNLHHVRRMIKTAAAANFLGVAAAIAAVLALLPAPSAWATGQNWLGTSSSSWNNAGNWHSAVPGAGDTALLGVTNGQTVVNSTIDLGAATFSLGSTTANTLTNFMLQFGTNGATNFTLQNGVLSLASPYNASGVGAFGVFLNPGITLNINATLNTASVGRGILYSAGNGSVINISTAGNDRFSFVSGSATTTNTAVMNINAANFVPATSVWFLGSDQMSTSGGATVRPQNLTLNINASQNCTSAANSAGWLVGWTTNGTENVVVIRNGASVTNDAELQLGGVNGTSDTSSRGRLQIGDSTTSGVYVSASASANQWGVGGGVGTVDVDNGTLFLNGQGTITLGYGNVATSQGILNLNSNGVVDDSSAFTRSANGVGTINFNGGKLKLDGNLQPAQAANLVSSGVTVNVLAGGGVIDLNSRSAAINAAISGAGVMFITNTGVAAGGALTNLSQLSSMVIGGGTVITPANGTNNAPNLTVGYDQTGCTNLALAGAAVNLGGGAATTLRVGYYDVTGGSGSASGTLDVSALGNFTANVGNLLVGYTSAIGGNGAVGRLALATNNTITATNVVVGYSANSTSGATQTMILGAGTNLITTAVLTVGGQKETGLLTSSNGGTLILTNAGGVSVNVGREDLSSTRNANGTVDLSAGTFIGNIGTLVIGEKSLGGTGGATGLVTIGSSALNNVTANSVLIGSLSGASSGSTAQGTLNFGGGNFMVNGNVTLASFDNGNGSASGTLNINGGTFGVAGNIVDGGGATALNVDGGVLNMKPTGAATAGSITVDSLLVNGTITNAMNVTANVNLSGGGVITNQTGTTTVGASGTLSPGSGNAIGTLVFDSSVTVGGATVMKLNRTNTPNSDSISAASLIFGGTLTVTNVGPALETGDTFELFQGPISGQFTATNLPVLSTGLAWDVSLLGSQGVIFVVGTNLTAPIFLPPSTVGTNLVVQVTSGTGFSYALQATPQLSPASWTDIQTNSGNGAATFTIPIDPSKPMQYFRIRSLPPPLLVQAATAPTNAAWNWYSTTTLDNLPSYVESGMDTNFSTYGGLLSQQTNATGYFYPLKVNGRWWLVDPLGCLFLHQGPDAISTINSTGANQALTNMFGTLSNWAAASTALMRSNSCNGAGAWTDTTDLRRVSPPLVYTIIQTFLGTYESTNTGPGWPYVFDPAFTNFCNKNAQQFTNTATDPWLLGYFSDNELPISSSSSNLLVTFLGLSNTNNSSYQAAWAWLRGIYGTNATTNQVTSQNKSDFIAYVWGRYYSVVSQAIKRYDPNHLFLGTKFNAGELSQSNVFTAIAPYVDVVSVDLYGKWTPDTNEIQLWAGYSGHPVIIAEFYTKGQDSGLPNVTGAGWVVPTQHDRGWFYENFVLTLIQSKNVVGWNWFRYSDNDPTAVGNDPSNINSNKGFVSNRYVPYYDLLYSVQRINARAHRLAAYYDGTLVP